MPIGTCDPASQGASFNSVTIESAVPDRSGVVLADVKFGWDGVSVRPNCDGPVVSIHTRNTSGMTAWALLPNKKKAPLWVQMDPGTDATVSAQGQLNSLGLTKYSDVAGVSVVFVQPG